MQTVHRAPGPTAAAVCFSEHVAGPIAPVSCLVRTGERDATISGGPHVSLSFSGRATDPHTQVEPPPTDSVPRCCVNCCNRGPPNRVAYTTEVYDLAALGASRLKSRYRHSHASSTPHRRASFLASPRSSWSSAVLGL